MGKIYVQGVGVLEIEGNEPNANEIEKISPIVNSVAKTINKNINV